MRRHSPFAGFLLGLWLGGSVFLVAVVTYNFVGITPSFEANTALAERAGFEPENENAKKTSVIWVYASELNRAQFTAWNRVQLALGIVTLGVVFARCRRRAAFLSVALALGIVVSLSFVLAPEIISIGRDLDFASREPPPPELESFSTLHRLYTGLELAKMALLLIALLFVVRGRVSDDDAGRPRSLAE